MLIVKLIGALFRWELGDCRNELGKRPRPTKDAFNRKDDLVHCTTKRLRWGRSPTHGQWKFTRYLVTLMNKILKINDRYILANALVSQSPHNWERWQLMPLTSSHGATVWRPGWFQTLIVMKDSMVVIHLTVKNSSSRPLYPMWCRMDRPWYTTRMILCLPAMVCICQLAFYSVHGTTFHWDGEEQACLKFLKIAMASLAGRSFSCGKEASEMEVVCFAESFLINQRLMVGNTSQTTRARGRRAQASPTGLYWDNGR